MSATSIIKSALSQPVVALAIASLSLLLLVVVLLSVPGPAQGLYWFQMDSPTGEGAVLKAGVMGWCWAGTSNCTYAALSENQYLNEMLDVGSAITVKTLVPLSCYWAIIQVIFWGILTVTAPAGYHVVGTDCLARHLYFNMVEVATLCMQLFGCILAWLAFGFTHHAYRGLKHSGVEIRSGNAMATIGVAAAIAMLGCGLGAYGLYLRIQEADKVWKEESYQNAVSAIGMPQPLMMDRGIENRPGTGIIGQFRASRMSSFSEMDPQKINSRLSSYSEVQREKGFGNAQTGFAVSRPVTGVASVLVVDEKGEEHLAASDEPMPAEVEMHQQVRRLSQSEPGPYPSPAVGK